MSKQAIRKPGPKSRALARRAEKVLFQNYGARDIAFVRGEGTHLWDADGKKYLDFLGGIAVTGLGHAHPKIAKAVAAQAQRLIHTSNLYLIEPQIRLAEELVKHSFADKAFFCNSGTEAMEFAIKLARRWGAQHGGRYEIVVAEKGFHGRTLGALSATPQPKYHEGFGPLLEGFKVAKLGDLASFEKLIGPKTCAVLVEPVQGEGGVNVPPSGFIEGLRKLCDEKKILLLFDEVQVGMGRLGSVFAYEQFGAAPDILSLAKGLGNGVPIGVVLAKNELAALMAQGSHGSTFGGNFLATSAALVVVQEVSKRTTLANVRRQGIRLRNGLEELAGEFPGRVKDIRGMGLLVGFELTAEAAPVIAAARERGLLVGGAGPNTIRFAPSLLVGTKEVDEALTILRECLEATSK